MNQDYFAPDPKEAYNQDKFDPRQGYGSTPFRQPTGIAAVKDAKGVEWLYVADVGNQRIVKFMIK